MIEIDVELALLDFPQDDFAELAEKLPASYIVEDKYKLGWGAVIRQLKTSPSVIDNAICVFLKDLEQMKKLISRYNGIIRIAVYHDTVTFTCRLSSIELLEKFSLEVEISAYPSEE